MESVLDHEAPSIVSIINLITLLPDMRLLNTRSWEMRDFISDDDIPPYAILSHTWDEEEVSFLQWEDGSSEISRLKGYQKIRQFGKLAGDDGFDWVWADTYVTSSG